MKKPEKLEGTTTVGVVCADGVVLASDSRATAGYLVASKEARKIYKITNQIAFTTAGGVADAQNLVNMLKAEAGYYSIHEGEPMRVAACARLVANIMNYYSWYPYIANLLVGGMDAKGPDLYFVDLDGGMTKEEMTATGSGSPVAYGVLENEFRSGMSTKEALPIMVKAIRTAMKRDIATGNEIRASEITKKGYRELSREEIKKLA